MAMTNGAWRAVGSWSFNANHDSDNPVWDAWGGSGQSLSGWVSDPAGATVRLRRADGSQVEEDTAEDGAVILVYETAHRDSVVEVLDKDGTVLHTAHFP